MDTVQSIVDTDVPTDVNKGARRRPKKESHGRQKVFITSNGHFEERRDEQAQF